MVFFSLSRGLGFTNCWEKFSWLHPPSDWSIDDVVPGGYRPTNRSERRSLSFCRVRTLTFILFPFQLLKRCCISLFITNAPRPLHKSNPPNPACGRTPNLLALGFSPLLHHANGIVSCIRGLNVSWNFSAAAASVLLLNLAFVRISGCWVSVRSGGFFFFRRICFAFGRFRFR